MKDYGDLEQITRAFCQKRGIDPDEQVPVPCPDGFSWCCVVHYGPAWKNHESLVRDGLALIETISTADSASEWSKP